MTCRANGEPATIIAHVVHEPGGTVSVYPVYVRIPKDMEIVFDEVEEASTIIIPEGVLN